MLQSYEWALEAMKYVASMRMEHCASAPGLDKLLRSLEHYLQHHPPMSDDTFRHMMDMAQRLHNDKLLEQCRLAKTRCQETYHLLLLRQNTLQRARDQLAAEQGVDNLGDDVLEDCGPEASNGDGGAEAAVPSSGGDKAASLSSGVAATSAVKSPVGVTSSSSSPALPAVAKDLKSVAEEEDDDFPVWEPRTTSTPTREEDWSDAYGLNRCRPPSSSSSAHYGLKEGGVESSFSDSPHLTTRDRSATVIANPMTAKTTTPSSASSPSPSPTSPSSRLPGRPAPLDSPRRDKPEFKTPAGKGPARLQLSRTIPQPATSLVSKLTALASPAAAKPGPLKKILKRASTAPVPMVTSPVIYEDREAGAGEADAKREQRDNKTLSMITGSSESLPR